MWQKNVRYLDYNASSPISAPVKQYLVELMGDGLAFANPSSSHSQGTDARRVLEQAVSQIHQSFQTGDTGTICFHASGTLANQHILKSALDAGWSVISSRGEHSSIYERLKKTADALPGRIYFLSLNTDGQPDMQASLASPEKAPFDQPKGILLSLSWVNSETGVVLSMPAVQAYRGALEKLYQCPVEIHLDGAQAWGKIALNVDNTPAHYVTATAHKIGAPAGVALVWARVKSQFSKTISDYAALAGTPSVLLVAAMGYAAKMHASDLAIKNYQQSLQSIQSEFENKILSLGMKVWGANSKRVVNTTRFSIPNFERYEDWVGLLDVRGFQISHGSACDSKVITPSRVLLAMGATRAEALNSIRVSTGVTSMSTGVTTAESLSLDPFIEQLQQVIQLKSKLKKNSTDKSNFEVILQ